MLYDILSAVFSAAIVKPPTRCILKALSTWYRFPAPAFHVVEAFRPRSLPGVIQIYRLVSWHRSGIGGPRAVHMTQRKEKSRGFSVPCPSEGTDSG